MQQSVIINIVNNTDPFSFPLIPKPVLDKFENVGFWILPAGDFYLIRNLPKTLLEPSFVTRMDPENPC